MLDALKKKLGILPAKEEVEMVEESQAQATTPVVDNTALEALQAAFNTQTEQLATLQANFAELTEKFASTEAALATATVALAEVEAAKAQAVAAAHEVKMDARLAKVKDVIGDVKAAAFVTATEMLDDAAFEAASSALAGSVEQESNTTLFKEVGVDAEADTSKDVEESPEMKIIKAKYAAQSANK